MSLHDIKERLKGRTTVSGQELVHLIDEIERTNSAQTKSLETMIAAVSNPQDSEKSNNGDAG